MISSSKWSSWNKGCFFFSLPLLILLYGYSILETLEQYLWFQEMNGTISFSGYSYICKLAIVSGHVFRVSVDSINFLEPYSGYRLQPSLWRMASALRSVFLSNDESIRFYLRLQVPRYGGYSKSVVDSKSNVATTTTIKMLSNGWGSRYQKFLRAHKVCSCVDTQNSNLFLSTCRKCKTLPQVTY